MIKKWSGDRPKSQYRYRGRTKPWVLAGPCLLHPTSFDFSEVVGLFIRQTFEVQAELTIQATKSLVFVCISGITGMLAQRYFIFCDHNH